MIDLRQRIVLALGDEEIRQAAMGPPTCLTSRRFGERLADRIMPLLAAEVERLTAEKQAERDGHEQARRAADHWATRAETAEAQVAHLSGRLLAFEAVETRDDETISRLHAQLAAVPPAAAPAEALHKPFTDDGITYCGWDGHEGCGEMWPCSTTRRARALFLAAALEDPA